MDKKSELNGMESLSSMLTNVISEGDDFEAPAVSPEEEHDQEEESILNPSEASSNEELEQEEEEQTEEETEEVEDTTGEETEEVEEADEVVEDIGEIENLGELEPQLATHLEERLYEKFGWEIDEENRASSIDSIVELLEKTVQDNSVPVYASNEIGELNEFVANGGSMRDFFNTKYVGDVDLTTVDLEVESNQDRVLREYFKEQGVADERIEKRIQRFEDTGIKQEEAEEAKDWLEGYREKKSEKLLQEQEKIKQETLKSQQKFNDDVISYIRSSKNIDGVALNKTEKEQLIKNIFQPLNGGKTLYQKMYEDSTVPSLVTSALDVTMKDKKKSRINKKISSSSAKLLKDKIRTTKNNPRMKGSGKSIETDSGFLGGLNSMLSGK